MSGTLAPTVVVVVSPLAFLQASIAAKGNSSKKESFFINGFVVRRNKEKFPAALYFFYRVVRLWWFGWMRRRWHKFPFKRFEAVKLLRGEDCFQRSVSFCANLFYFASCGRYGWIVFVLLDQPIHLVVKRKKTQFYVAHLFAVQHNVQLQLGAV